MNTRRVRAAVLGLAVAGMLVLSAVPAAADTPPRPPQDVKETIGKHAGGGLGALAADDDVFYQVASTPRSPQRARVIAEWEGLAPFDTTIDIKLVVSSSAPCNLTFELFDYTTRSWDAFVTFAASTVEATLAASLPAATYVNNDGEARVRLTCSGTAGRYLLRFDQLTAGTTT